MIGPLQSIVVPHFRRRLPEVSLGPVRHALLPTRSQMRSACQRDVLFRSQRKANESQFSVPDSDHALQREWYPDIPTKLFRELPWMKYPGGLLVHQAQVLAVQ